MVGDPSPRARPLQHEPLTRAIIGGAMRVHRTLGPGFLESVCRNALAWELRLARHSVQLERRLQVRYRDALVGEFVADMLVDDCVLVELKAATAIVPAHEAQLVNYLAATGIEIGLLLNFGAEKLQIRRMTRRYESGRQKKELP